MDDVWRCPAPSQDRSGRLVLPASARLALLRCVLQSPGGDLPFLFTAIHGPYQLLHGDHVQLLAAVGTKNGFLVELPPYDSRLELQNGGPDPVVWTGTWTKAGPAGAVAMPVRCESWELAVDDTAAGHSRTRLPLFPLAGEPWDPAGRWAVRFANSAEPAVAIFTANRGEFSQLAGEIQGTFLTVTGDYRWLAGTARGDEIALSCFDGAHAFLLAARRQADGSLRGDFWSGTGWHAAWQARRDDAAALPDAFTLTTARPEPKLGELAYPDLDSETGVARRLDTLFGKATLVMLFGTWCPNCSDAGALLAELDEHHRASGLRIIGLAFEHGDDPHRHRRVVGAYRALHRIGWPILLAGGSDQKKASAAFPAIDQLRAFPTILFVDAVGALRAVHQGFAGPATGREHQVQRHAFEALVVRLLAEAATAADKK